MVLNQRPLLIIMKYTILRFISKKGNYQHTLEDYSDINISKKGLKDGKNYR